MEGILELQRRTHEVVDHLEEAIVQAMLQQAKTHKGRLMQEHFVSSLLDQININAERLESFYADDTLRNAELETITISSGSSGSSDTGNFYEQLKGIKDRHRRLGTTIEDLVETEAIMGSARLTDESLSKKFSGEESLGRYLDLQEPYEMYINLKDIKKTEYLRYLHDVGNFMAVPMSTKSGAPYKAYLCSLKSYLESFFERTRPLFNLASFCKEQTAEFEALWESASVPGWEEISNKESDDMYCGPCEKQFYNESVFKAHFSGKKHQKAAANKTTRTATGTTEGKWAKDVAKMEHLIVKYLGFFEKDLEETKNNVEAKQSRSSAERALDLEREEEALEKSNEPAKKEAGDDEDSDDPKIYNPLNLPLDWDGKPIPYWLWKLHGLGTRYPCEICGNQVYMGRKAFDQHFYEWRHSHGLRCLGIPNTRHFFQVTSIQDAMALWAKLKKDAKQANFRPDVMEELEDQHGNVYSRKTYEDLSRQGII